MDVYKRDPEMDKSFTLRHENIGDPEMTYLDSLPTSPLNFFGLFPI